jgi:SAM-dependent methyltransferase
MPTASAHAAKKIASRVIWTVGLQDAVFRVREHLLARKGDTRRFDDDGTPLPGPHLRVLVGGSADLGWFVDGGRSIVEEFEQSLQRVGASFATARNVLDVGCGCGRLARWVLRKNANLTGVDINAQLLAWCRKNLPGSWVLCRLHQPMPLPAESFELAYACSVITHLREDTARAWLGDVSRVMARGGHFILTFHDEVHPNAQGLRDMLATDYAVRFDSLEGSNHLAAFATIDKLKQIAPRDFELALYTPSDQTLCKQAISIWRKT